MLTCDVTDASRPTTLRFPGNPCWPSKLIRFEEAWLLYMRDVTKADDSLPGYLEHMYLD